VTTVRECDYRDSAELELAASEKCQPDTPEQRSLLAKGEVWALLAISLAIDEQTAVLRTVAGDVAHLRSALTHG
jgi:hypothetical protein